MKRIILLASLLALGSEVEAADLSKNVWSFIAGNARHQPMLQSNKDGGVSKVWMVPEGLQATFAYLLYAPKFSTNHWAFMLADPQLPMSDYFGTNKWSKADVVKDAKDPKLVLHFYRLNGGMYDGLYGVDEVIFDNGQRQRLVMLLTPQMHDLFVKNKSFGEVMKR